MLIMATIQTLAYTGRLMQSYKQQSGSVQARYLDDLSLLLASVGLLTGHHLLQHPLQVCQLTPLLITAAGAP